MSETWEPKTGEWVAVRRADESKPWGHRRVIKRTPMQVHVDYYGTPKVYRRNCYGEWANRSGVPGSILMPATRTQSELEAEFMREVRESERRRLRSECDAAVRTAYERGDDDAIRRAIHELEKGTK